MRAHHLLFVIAAFFGLVGAAIPLRGQTTVDPTQHLGIDPYGSYAGSNIDHVDMKSGNLSAQIPLFSLPQKGQLSLGFELDLNNNGWTFQSNCDDYGCINSAYRTTAIGPKLNLTPNFYVSSYYFLWEKDAAAPNYCEDSGCGLNAVMGYNVADTTGASHALLIDGNNNATLRSIDGSEFLYVPSFSRPFDLYAGMAGGLAPNPLTQTYLNRAFVTSPPGGLGATGGFAPGTIYTAAGVSYYYPATYNVSYGSSSGPEVISDTNGNQIMIAFQDVPEVTDSVGRTFSYPTDPVATTTGCPVVVDPGDTSPTAPTASSTWTVPGPNGQVTYLICYTSVPVNTNFAFPDDQNEYSLCPPGWGPGGEAGDCNEDEQAVSGDGGYQAIQSVSIIPNGGSTPPSTPISSFWGFSYNPSDPSDPYQYGDISQIILPTGGSIQYTYYPDNPVVDSASRFIKTRTMVPAAGTGESNATWTYSWNLSDLNGKGYFGPYSSAITGPSPDNIVTSYTYDQSGTETVSTAKPGGESETTTTTYYGTVFVGPAPDTSTPLAPPFSWDEISTQWSGGGTAAQIMPHAVTTTISSGGSSYSATSTYSYDTANFLAAQLNCNMATAPGEMFQWSDNCAAIGTTTGTGNTPGGFVATTLAPLGSRTGSVVTGINGNTLRSTTTSYEWQTNSAYYLANLLDRPAQQSSYSGQAVAAQTTYTYDESTYNEGGLGNLTTVTQANSPGSPTTTHSYYTSSGLLWQTSDPNNNLTTFTDFDACDGSSSQPSGAVEKTSASALFPHTTVHAYNTSVALSSKTTHDCNTGSATQSQDANDIAANRPGTIYTYDYRGNPLTIQYPDNGSTTFNYNNYAIPFVISKQVTPLQSSYTYEDGFGRTIKTKDPSGAKVDTAYSGMGEVISVSNPYFTSSDSTYGATTFSYDWLGRKTRQVNSDSVSTQTWSYNGPTVTYTNENNSQWQSIYDELGRLTQVIEPGTLTTVYHYDVLNNLLSVSQSGNGVGDVPRVRTFSYDWLSRLVCTSNPEISSPQQPQGSCPATATSSYVVGTTQYVYDANGNVKSKTSPSVNVATGDQTTGYCYDALNRPTYKFYTGSFSCSNPSGYAVSYNYDTSGVSGAQNTIGRLTDEKSYAGNTLVSDRQFYSYDAMGRLLNENQYSYAGLASGKPYPVAYQYDLAGHLIASTDGTKPPALQYVPPSCNGLSAPTWTTLFFFNCYDGAGRLSSLTANWSDPTHPPNLFNSPGYAAFGGLSQASYANGLTLTRSYDNRQRMTQEVDSSNGSAPTAGSATVTIVGSEKSH
jgi:hypothetical protein